MKFVILAGGYGTRLWPVSTRKIPKQFAKLLGEETLLEITLNRLRRRFADDDIYISVNKEEHLLVHQCLPHFREDRIIVEPEARDTATAIGFAAALLARQFPDEPIAFAPADHFIAKEDLFLDTIELAGQFTSERGVLADIAVPAIFPSTVLGYTRIGKKLEERNGISVYTFCGHVEKPDFQTAKKYLVDSSYLWHAGYFIWTPEKILQAFDKHMPTIGAILRQIRKNDNAAEQERLFCSLEKISFDYAIVEKLLPEEVLILKADFGWSDIGAWDVFAAQLTSREDEQENVVLAKKWLGIDTSGSLIYGGPEKIIATIGVDGLVIVDTEHALLVCPKSRAQDVKQIVKRLEEGDRYETPPSLKA